MLSETSVTSYLGRLSASRVVPSIPIKGSATSATIGWYLEQHCSIFLNLYLLGVAFSRLKMMTRNFLWSVALTMVSISMEVVAVSDSPDSHLISTPISQGEFERLTKKRQSGNSPRRPEHVRPDESDVEAFVAWTATNLPSSRARVAEELVRWHGSTCQLCGEPVDMTLKGIHPGRWNVDHILPKANGGLNTWGNVQLTHKACNGQKLNLVLPEPPPWLYAQLRRAAISKFECNGIHVQSEIEVLRSRASLRVAVHAMESQLVQWNLENSKDEAFKARVRNYLAMLQGDADDAIALVAQCQAVLVAERAG